MLDLFNTYASLKKRCVNSERNINFGVEFHTESTDFYKILPISEDCIKDKDIIRFVAAQVNNWLMIFGAQKIVLHCPFVEFSIAIVNELHVHYPQIWNVLSDFYQSSFNIEFSADPLILHSPHFFSKYNYKIQKISNKIYSIGINIGQSAIKAVVLHGDQIIYNTKIAIPTPKTFKEVIYAVKNLISKYTSQYDVSCIGICIGGIVRWGSLTTKSGISITWTQNEFLEFQNIVNDIENKFGILTTLYQDMICSGYSISYFQSAANSLVLGLGTSTGGVYIDQEGTLPDFLNQVGRVAIDLSEQAVKRVDGKAKGVVSQYFSINGIKQLTKGNLDIAFTDEVIEEFLDYAVTSICIFLDHYDPQALILTGGFWGLDINNRFMASLRDKLRQIYGQNIPSIYMSHDTLYDACIGAALMAGGTCEKLDYAGKLINKFVAESLVKHIPACISYTQARAGLMLLNSEQGRNKYIDFNRRFVEQLVNNSSIDLNINRRLLTTIQLLISDLNLVGELTPQEVQSIAARVVHQITENPDPFNQAKQKNNLMVLELIEKAGIESFLRPNYPWASNLKNILVFSALLNGLDVFYPESLLEFLRQFNKTTALNNLESVQKLLEKVAKETEIVDFVGYDDFALFEKIISNNAGCKILYFVDNSGEIIFDMLACLVLLQEGYRVTVVSKSEPFADDVYENDIKYLIDEFPGLANFLNTGQLRLSFVSSDFLDCHESFIEECSSASIYIAKGTRNVNFLWQKDLIMPGLHVALNKSETVQSILASERKSLGPVVFVFQSIGFQ